MQTNTTPSLKPIEIFRPGTFTAVNGSTYSFSAEQVRELAETYNPGFSDAPLVVGHPKLTSPRFGRVGKLYIDQAGVLCAEPEHVIAEFAAAVNAKHYPKVSASIFLPDAPGNPTPGKHYLRHVGFLGGVAPAVKGLEMVEFAGSDEGVAEFGYEDRIVTRLFRNVRDWFVETIGIDKAQQLIPDYDLSSLESIVTREEMGDSTVVPSGYPAFSDPHQPSEAELNQQNAQREQELNEKEAALKTREAELRIKEAAAVKTGSADFAETLVAAGKLLPGQKAQIVEILTQLESANLVADFAAGDDNHGKTGAELFKDFLNQQPKQVEFSRVSPPAGAATGTADFASPAGEQVDQEGLVTLTKANAYMQAHPGVGFIDAVQAVQDT